MRHYPSGGTHLFPLSRVTQFLSGDGEDDGDAAGEGGWGGGGGYGCACVGSFLGINNDDKKTWAREAVGELNGLPLVN